MKSVRPVNGSIELLGFIWCSYSKRLKRLVSADLESASKRDEKDCFRND